MELKIACSQKFGLKIMYLIFYYNKIIVLILYESNKIISNKINKTIWNKINKTILNKINKTILNKINKTVVNNTKNIKKFKKY